ncbi:MAG: conjugal transfer protein TraX [Lachnospiraceae bacterium]|nr:conjugal transfer protein TraX [Lachnospiraceae bacterium]
MGENGSVKIRTEVPKQQESMSELYFDEHSTEGMRKDDGREREISVGGKNGRAKRGLSGSDLKIIAIVTMFIDHFAAVILYESLISGAFRTQTAWNVAYYTYDILRLVIGRISFPIFCFLLVQGFEHTRNRVHYALRLFAFALVSEIPFDLAFNQPLDGVLNRFSVFGLQFLEFDSQNVFFTLLLGLLVMMLTDVIMKTRIPLPDLPPEKQKVQQIRNTVILVIRILLAAAVLWCGVNAGNFFQTDYSGYGVLVIAVLYYLNRFRNEQIAVGTFAMIFGDYAFNGSVTELLAPIGLLLTKFYNGERGMRMKYFFYVFYPVHLLLLVALREVLF